MARTRPPDFGEINIDHKGAINGLKEWRAEVDKALQTRVYPQLRVDVVYKAKARAPVGTLERGSKNPGALKASIRPMATKRSANIKIGGTMAVPYAAPVHWGWDGHTGPWFAFRVGYPKATKKKPGPVADWIWDRIVNEVNETTKRLNKHLARDIQLAGAAFKTGE